MKNLDQETWRNQLAKDENAVLLDVRTPEEYKEGYIPGCNFSKYSRATRFYE